MWEGIRYTIIPNSRILNASNNFESISLDIFADDSSLEFFGILLDNHTYDCIPVSCNVNISGSPAGGVATVKINLSSVGSFDIHYFFKKAGFNLQYIHGSTTGVDILTALFGENLGIILEDLGEDLRTESMRSVFAAIVITALCVLAGQLGVIGIGLLFVAILGTMAFTLAGFITPVLGVITITVGLFAFFVFMKE